MKKINNFVTTNLYLIKLKLDWLEMLRNIVKIRISDSKMCPLINEFNVCLGGRRLPMGADIFVYDWSCLPLNHFRMLSKQVHASVSCIDCIL